MQCAAITFPSSGPMEPRICSVELCLLARCKNGITSSCAARRCASRSCSPSAAGADATAAGGADAVLLLCFSTPSGPTFSRTVTFRRFLQVAVAQYRTPTTANVDTAAMSAIVTGSAEAPLAQWTMVSWARAGRADVVLHAHVASPPDSAAAPLAAHRTKVASSSRRSARAPPSRGPPPLSRIMVVGCCWRFRRCAFHQLLGPRGPRRAPRAADESAPKGHETRRNSPCNSHRRVLRPASRTNERAIQPGGGIHPQPTEQQSSGLNIHSTCIFYSPSQFLILYTVNNKYPLAGTDGMCLRRRVLSTQIL